MAEVGDLIDFDAIETQKENIRSIPGGRSAKQLSLLCSPLSSKVPAPLTETQDLRNAAREDFEKELLSASESDDPLDIYDRYIKWTLSAYPSASSTTSSGLLPLLERATRAFLHSPLYKNDPRYLKTWLLYIHLFADSPRETYAFLATHGVGDALALYYEEFAAWLETQGRWTQAEEVFALGVERDARPAERLIRKYAEFQHRRETRAAAAVAQAGDGPASPALPKVRPALVAKTDPFATHAGEERDPQARDREAVATASAKPKNGKKLAVFVDGEDGPAKSDSGPSTQGWDNIGSITERKKENTHEAKPWAGEKLDGGRKLTSGQKMMVFRDPSLHLNDNDISPSTMSRASQRCVTINPKTGKPECVFSDLEAVYPNGVDANSEEFSFEELRARHRGWLEKDWSKPKPSVKPAQTKQITVEHEATCHLDLPTQSVLLHEEGPVKVLMESHPPQTVPLKGEAALKKANKEEKANRTRKIKVMEIRAETQTVQINLDSPTRPKLRKKRPAEATMTIHTKEAMDEVYDIFNQPLDAIGTIAEEQENEDEDPDEDDDDDDCTSMGESTGTGRISASASEYGGDETTSGEFTASSARLTDGDTSTRQTVDDEDDDDDDDDEEEFTHTTATGTGLEDEEDLSWVNVEDGELARSKDNTVDKPQEREDGTTPTSPNNVASDEYFNSSLSHVGRQAPSTSLPYRAGKGVSRLPFMTPIVEKTESSIGAATARAEAKFASLKTPSRENYAKSMGDIDETEQFSSPFDDSTENYDKENIKIAQPALPKLDRSKQPLGVSKAFEAPLKEVINEKPVKGPIILDSQCNPMDETIRQSILTRVHPPVSTYAGYYEMRGLSSGRGADIRKFVKASGKGGKSSGTDNGSIAPIISLDGSSHNYTIRRELGRGAFAPVYLADSKPKSGDNEEDRIAQGIMTRHDQEVIKMEDPPSAWEFFVLRQAKRRLGVSRASSSIVEAHEMHLFADECFLIEEYRNQGTLLDCINVCRASETTGAMDELLAMFFAVELLRTVEGLHAKGIIHGDLKPDNVLLRFEEEESCAWSAQYDRNGGSGWADKGLLLIDFGRGVDMRAFSDGVQFIADWKTTEADCVEMREMRPWTFQVDYHGLAGIVHGLLFGKYMEVVKMDRGMPGTSRRYGMRETLKRYWQTDIWNAMFDLLLNPLMFVEKEDGGKLPVLNELKSLRLRMEEYLEGNCEKGVGLKGLIRRLEGSMRERRK